MIPVPDSLAHLPIRGEQLADLDELLALSRELELPVCYSWLGLEVFRAGCRVHGEAGLSRSYTRNMYNGLTSQLCSVNFTTTDSFGDGHLTFQDTGGTNRRAARFSNCAMFNLETDGVQADDTYGIVVGTNAGASAESFEDSNLDTLIAHGNLAGEFYYWNTKINTPTWDSVARTWSCDIIRYMSNLSGGSITVNEIGLITRARNSSSSYAVLMIRDVLDSGVAVADEEMLKVTYSPTTAAFPS